MKFRRLRSLSDARNERKITKLSQVSCVSIKSSEDIMAEIGQAYQGSNRVSTIWENYSNAEIINSSLSPSLRERQPK